MKFETGDKLNADPDVSKNALFEVPAMPAVAGQEMKVEPGHAEGFDKLGSVKAGKSPIHVAKGKRGGAHFGYRPVIGLLRHGPHL